MNALDIICCKPYTYLSTLFLLTSLANRDKSLHNLIVFLNKTKSASFFTPLHMFLLLCINLTHAVKRYFSRFLIKLLQTNSPHNAACTGFTNTLRCQQKKEIWVDKVTVILDFRKYFPKDSHWTLAARMHTFKESFFSEHHCTLARFKPSENQQTLKFVSIL